MKMMRDGYLLLYEGKRNHDPDEIRHEIRQAFCAKCGRLWNISRKQRIFPYFCPACSYHKGGRHDKRGDDRQDHERLGRKVDL